MYKYYKYTTFGFCIGHIKIKVSSKKDKYDLILPDPFQWKIYDHNKKKFKKETILFTNLSFDFQSLINNLPYKRNTLEESLFDGYCNNQESYEEVTYMIFIGLDGHINYKTDKFSEKYWNNKGYNINKIYEIQPMKKGKIVVKNIHYWGAWLGYTGFI